MRHNTENSLGTLQIPSGIFRIPRGKEGVVRRTNRVAAAAYATVLLGLAIIFAVILATIRTSPGMSYLLILIELLFLAGTAECLFLFALNRRALPELLHVSPTGLALKYPDGVESRFSWTRGGTGLRLVTRDRYNGAWPVCVLEVSPLRRVPLTLDASRAVLESASAFGAIHAPKRSSHTKGPLSRRVILLSAMPRGDPSIP